jgi:hypothetical protein
MGRAKAPKGFYTAAQAIKRLGLAKSTFYDMVDRGQIKKVTPPNRRDGFYSKPEIDRMAKEQEAFLLQIATDVSTFEPAQEEDIEGIAELGAELFGGNKESRFNLCLAQYQANPEIFHVVKQNGIVVAYVGAFPLKHEAIEKITSGMSEALFRVEVLSPENIAQFRPGQADEVFLIIGAKQDTKKSKLYGSRAIAGSIEFLETLARRGVIVKKLYATSRTQDGIRICKGMGFKQITPEKEEDNLLRFELDLETTTSPLFKEYQRLVKLATNQTTKEKP